MQFGDIRSTLSSLPQGTQGQLAFNQLLWSLLKDNPNDGELEAIVYYINDVVMASSWSDEQKWTIITNMAIALDLDPRELDRPAGFVMVLRDDRILEDYSEGFQKALGESYKEYMTVFVDRRIKSFKEMNAGARERWENSAKRSGFSDKNDPQGPCIKKSWSEFGIFIRNAGEINEVINKIGGKTKLEDPRNGAYRIACCDFEICYDFETF